MAFQRTNAQTNVSNFPRPEALAQNDRWKADAFVNLYLPTRDGNRVKLGAVSLSADKPTQKQLLDFIADGGEDALNQLKDRLILDFKRADGNNGTELDLG